MAFAFQEVSLLPSLIIIFEPALESCLLFIAHPLVSVVILEPVLQYNQSFTMCGPQGLVPAKGCSRVGLLFPFDNHEGTMAACRLSGETCATREPAFQQQMHMPTVRQ